MEEEKDGQKEKLYKRYYVSPIGTLNFELSNIRRNDLVLLSTKEIELDD